MHHRSIVVGAILLATFFKFTAKLNLTYEGPRSAFAVNEHLFAAVPWSSHTEDLMPP